MLLLTYHFMKVHKIMIVPKTSILRMQVENLIIHFYHAKLCAATIHYKICYNYPTICGKVYISSGQQKLIIMKNSGVWSIIFYY